MKAAEHTAARKAIWEAERTAPAVEQPALPLGTGYGEEAAPASGESGRTPPTFQPTGRGNKGFAADTAKKTGRR